MFKRPNQSYQIEGYSIHRILKDQSNPLNQISKIIPSGSSVLDIGCGNGILSRVVKLSSKQIDIDGIEPNEFAAELAKPFYKTIYRGYAQDYLHSIKSANYDYIILADVIEHIPDPQSFLEDLISHLSDKTKLIISIPNVAFGGVRLSLLNGYFDYVDSGLLERTHLRFFTLENAVNFFNSCSVSCELILNLERSFYRVEFPRKKIRSNLINILNLSFRQDARAYQYLFLLSKAQVEVAETKFVRVKSLQIIFDAIFYRSWIKSTAVYLKNMVN